MMDSKEFDSLVLKDVQGAADETDVAEHLELNPHDWRESLVALQRSVDTKLSQAKERNAENPDEPVYRQWRKRTVYFRSCVEKKLAHVNTLLDPEGKLARGFKADVIDRLDRIENLLQGVQRVD